MIARNLALTHLHPVYLCTGAADLIQQARSLGMAVGVGSSGAPEKIARNLALSGLAPLLDPAFTVSTSYVARVSESVRWKEFSSKS